LLKRDAINNIIKLRYIIYEPWKL